MRPRRVVRIRAHTVELVEVTFRGRRMPLYRALGELGVLTVIEPEEPLDRQEKRW